MKALTISQPFASLIASGEKWIENRCWRTYYRGPLAIHAGLGRQYLDRAKLAAYPTSRIVAVVDMIACLSWGEIATESERRPMERPTGVHRCWREIFEDKHCEGPWCWILSNVRIVESDEIRGARGLWDLPAGFNIRNSESTEGRLS